MQTPGMAGRTLAPTEHIAAPVQQCIQDNIFTLVQQQRAAGYPDMSGREIQSAYERVYESRIEASTVSSRVNALVSMGRLTRSKISRACRVTGRQIYPVRLSLTAAAQPVAAAASSPSHY